MNREVLDRWCERGILGLVLAILVFGPLALGAVRGLEFGVIQALTSCVMLLWLVRLWVNRKPQLLWPPICWAVLAFTAYAIVRYLTADIEYLARQEMLRVLVYASLFLAILNNLHRQETTQIIGFTLIFLALAEAGYAIYQFAANSDYVWHFHKPYPRRGSGTYFSSNHLGGFLEMLLPLALAYTLTGRLRPVTKVLLGYAALVIVAGIVVTLSRGAWVSTGVAMVLLFLLLMFRRQYRLPALAALVALIGIGVAGVFLLPENYLFQQRFKQLALSTEEKREDMRLVVWQPALRMWRDNFWWGAGPAHFDARFRGYRPEGIQSSPVRVHNDYLNTLADWGLVGAVLVASAWVLLGVGVYQTWRSPRLAPGDLGGKTMSNKYAFVLGGTVGLGAILVHSVVDFNMHIPANAILAVTLMALLSSFLRFGTDRYWLGAGLWIKALATAVILAELCYLPLQAWRRASEFVWLQRAEKSPAFSKERIALLTRAFSIEPKNPQTAYALAEAFRRQSQEGGEYYEGQSGMDYRKLAARAMEWFQQGMALNRWDSRNYSGYGWCLDWLDRTAESDAYFSRAEELDPNNYYNLNSIGGHCIQLGDYAAAKPWFERSLRLQWEGNEIAMNYLKIVEVRMLEAATNEISAKLEIVPH